MRSRIVCALASSVALSGCLTTEQALQKTWGYENGLLVHAVASVDEVWFIESEGMVFFGEVTPGRWYGDPIRFNPNDDPPTAPFVAALSLKELDSRRPRLHHDRFHRVNPGDEACFTAMVDEKRAEAVPMKKPRSVDVVDPRDVRLKDLQLEQQVLRIWYPKVEPVYDVALGPRGGDWLYALALPFTALRDAGRFAWTWGKKWWELPPVSSPSPAADPAAEAAAARAKYCADLVNVLFQHPVH